MPRHERNLSLIELLHPPFARLVERWLAGQDALGRHITLVQGRRTIAEQDTLFAQGRTTAGRRVTNARGGFSFHNYGLAIDFLDAGLDDKVQQADWEATDYAEIVRPAVAMGMEWGGAWRKNVDRPHLEWHPGLTARDAARLMSKADADGFLPADMWADWISDAGTIA
jgi:peptidoglycan L-alanyl-D-glutamate endopeptidase CwlK